MFGAASAAMDKLLMEGSARPVSAHRSGPGGDSCLLRKALKRSLVEINLLEDLPVGGTDLFDGVVHATTETGGSGFRGGRLKLGSGHQGAVFHGTVTMVIDDAVAKDAKEPGFGGVAGLEGAGMTDGAGIRGLENVLGGGAVADPALNEGEKAVALCRQKWNGFEHLLIR